MSIADKGTVGLIPVTRIGCTTHTPLDLNLSKLAPWSAKTVLLGYFGHNSYKLLDKTTGAMFKSRDVIFKEGTTYIAKQVLPKHNLLDTNPFLYKRNAHKTPSDASQDATTQTLQGIAP